jgi:hypothetical protein
MPVNVTLKKYLTQRNLSTYKLVQATTPRVGSQNAPSTRSHGPM